MAEQYTKLRMTALLPPALVLVGYAWFIVATYRPYLDWQLRLRSLDLAGLPEDIIGYGFWMWWPVAALLFILSLAVTLWTIQRRLDVAIAFLAVFGLLSSADYLLCQRLVQELIRSLD